MDVAHITNIRRAIIDVLEGRLGRVRVPAGTFQHGVFAEMPLDRQLTVTKGAKARHCFDVRFGDESTHVASMISNLGSDSIDAMSVEIMCHTHKRSTLPEFERTAALDYIVADGNEAKQALKEPGALSFTLDGVATLIPSGFMHGPGFTGQPERTRPIEDWENNIVRWSLVGALILHVPQNEPE